MNKSFWLFLLILSLTLVLSSQERYLEPITGEVIQESHTYATKSGENLDLDIYLPAYDNETERVTLINVHGGGFQNGERDSENIQNFCKELATHGYVVASISYRLTRKGKEGGFGCDCPASEKLNTFNAAVEDLQDATFYLIQNRERFGIDPLKIILAGSSAGAETVLNAAYRPPYCYGLDSGPVSYAGVIGMAGAITDTVNIYPESAIPSLLFHGTADKLVPYATAPHHYCDKNTPGYILLHGSKTIAYKLDQLKTPCWLHTSCGGGHEMANKPMSDYFPEIVEFCYRFVVKEEGETRHTIVKTNNKNSEFETFNFCEE